MCEVPPRRLRTALQPARVALGVIAVALIVAGMLLHDTTGLVIAGLGAAALLGAVLFPVVREFEFGFPTGIRVSAALRDREQELTEAFEGQRGDLGLCAHLLCGNPTVAAELLEAAWARTAALWRGPVTPELRTFVLCVFVQLLTAHIRWNGDASSWAEPPENGAVRTPLAALPGPMRTVVVLRDFAEIPLAQIAAMTDRPLADVASDLRAAEATLDHLSIEGTAP